MSSADEAKKSKPSEENPSSSSATASEETKQTSTSQTENNASAKAEGGDEAKVQPLAPPPKPSQDNPQATPDYFSSNHNNANQFSLEPNPFEQSFGNPATDTPGKFGGLPSVASLTSPAPLGRGNTPNWQNSLRSGPLSPAMLQGPTNTNGYFDESFRQSYPTPNESSLRTGLTPGGGGSMFPAPSPNTQAIFNLQSSGATPGTLEFQRTAMKAAASNMQSNGQGVNKAEYQPAQQQQPGRQDDFSGHENEAVNSLFMLASNGAGRNASNNQFAMQNQQQQAMNNNLAQMQQRMANQDSSPSNQRGKNQSVSSIGQMGDFDGSDDSPDSKQNDRSGRGKKGGNNKGQTNGRRKAEETPKGSAKKKSKGNNGSSVDMDDMDDMDDDDGDDDGGNTRSDGKRLTDEEKRKNFLERNRVAALKCRQRKKQWLANLQTKVEIFTSENDALTGQCQQLREEIINLKTLLLAHKDCPVSHQQGLGGNNMAQFMGEFQQPSHFMHNNQQMMGMQAGQGMQRR